MNRIVFVADLFWFDGSVGGAELCDGAIIEELIYKKYSNFREWMVLCAPSHLVSPDFIEKNKESFFIISNFMRLSEQSKKHLADHDLNYIIIEHDHKYITTNNPALYKNFLCREDHLQNQEFYRKARYVMCQSTLHTEILYKNLLLTNLVNLKGNLWLDLHLDILEKQIENKVEENRKFHKDEDQKAYERKKDGLRRWWKTSVINSDNPNKGTPQSIKYCQDNNLEIGMIPPQVWKEFMTSLAFTETLVFLPTWVESFNRVCVEARVLGCKIVTNQNLGCASDGWLQYKGTEMLQKVRDVKKEILSIYDDIIQNKDENIETYIPLQKLPRVSIITTFVEAEEYVEEFLRHICQQTIFEDIDLIICDAGSTGQEREIIEKYCQKYSNIEYVRTEEKIGSSEAFNLMIQKTKNGLIGMISMDDRPTPDYAEILRKHLYFSKTDLVYGDCWTTSEKNINLIGLDCKKKPLPNPLYEHSQNDFTRENMIKSLPGPMPMFKKSMIERNGGFDTNYKHVNDWELWLRCVRGGSEFQKVHTPVGAYYHNPAGVTTSKKTFHSKLKEENKVFLEYIDVLGEYNHHIYKEYFGQLNQKEKSL